MEACYINTAHPDFLNGHQAIAIVNEQLHPKPQQPTGPESTGKSGRHHQQQHSQYQQQQQHLAALQTTNSSSTSVDSNGDQSGSFFGSFFAGPKKTKKANALMDAVIIISSNYIYILSFVYFRVINY